MRSEKDIIVSSPAKLTAFTAVMTACVTLVTVSFQLYISATGGYFNLGESMVYLSGLLFGPYVGAFSGGFGSALADVFTGFGFFAPGTLVIKGVEGFIVGSLSQRVKLGISKDRGKRISVLTGLAIGIYLALVGIGFYSGLATLTGGGGAWWSADVIIEPVIWVVISVFAALLVLYAIHRSGVGGVISVLSMLIGGASMVAGYFLYEQLVLGKVLAILEVPFNIMQCLIGIVIALPVYRRVRQAITI
nr:ECF transporter S component [Candidatus Njordarchaeum guaymaensis]